MSEETLEVLPGDNIDLTNDAEEIDATDTFELAHMPEPYDAPAEYDSTNRVVNVAQAQHFKDSKCRDENGALLVVYANTTSEDMEFSVDTIKASPFVNSFLFTSILPAQVDEGYFIHEYYLNLVKPFIYRGTESLEDLTNSLRACGVACAVDLDTIDSLNDFALQTCGELEFVSCLHDAGFDGLINLATNEVLAFDANQVLACSNTLLS